MTLNFAAGIYGDEAIAAMSVVSRISNLIFSVGVGIVLVSSQYQHLAMVLNDMTV